jgi:hypothetical protein
MADKTRSEALTGVVQPEVYTELKTGTLSTTIDTGASVGVSVVAAWLWNISFPEMPMPAEVAAGVGAVVGPLVEDIRRMRRSLVDRWIGE